MRMMIVAAALITSACAQQVPVEVTNSDDIDTTMLNTIEADDAEAGTPFDVPSDAKARYTLLKVEPGPGSNIIATTRRDGPSGTSYARREIACAGLQARYVGEGDTLVQAQAPAPNPGEMSDTVEGSITDVAAKFACDHQ